MLFRRDFALFHFVTRVNLGQTAFVVILVIAAFVIDFQKAVKQHHLPIGAQTHLPIGRGDFHHRPLHPRGGHLAGDSALPDQVVQLALISLDQTQLFGGCGHIGGANAFMRFLGVLRLIFIHPRAVRHIGRTKGGPDHIAGRHDSLGGHVNAVSAHISNMARLIKPLGRRHTGLGPHAIFTAGFLLQGRCHEGRIGVSAGRLLISRDHLKCSIIDS